MGERSQKHIPYIDGRLPQELKLMHFRIPESDLKDRIHIKGHEHGVMVSERCLQGLHRLNFSIVMSLTQTGCRFLETSYEDFCLRLSEFSIRNHERMYRWKISAWYASLRNYHYKDELLRI